MISRYPDRVRQQYENDQGGGSSCFAAVFPLLIYAVSWKSSKKTIGLIATSLSSAAKVHFSSGLAHWALSAQKCGEMSIRTAVHRLVQNGRALLHSFRNTECFYSNFHQRNYHDKIHVVQVGKSLERSVSPPRISVVRGSLVQLTTKTDSTLCFLFLSFLTLRGSYVSSYFEFRITSMTFQCFFQF